MPINQLNARIAMVGFGPRGLGALEALVASALENRVTFSIDIFDPFKWPGAGQNYDPDQSEHCILNIPLRSLSIDPPAFLEDRIGTFEEWTTKSYEPDDFPPRSDVGAYCHARFTSLLDTAKETATFKHRHLKISGLERVQSDWWLTSTEARHGPYDEVLLTQGQPTTAPDPQLKRWIDHASLHDLALLPAYPANDLISAADHWRDKTVAIRGLGLSTFDVLRMLTAGLGGSFVGDAYVPSGYEPYKILPFSLNGRPPAPKPANAAIDRGFDPIDEETNQYHQALATALSGSSEDALRILCDALVAPTCRILEDLNSRNGAADVQLWLEFERENAGAQEYLGALDTLEAGIEMSHGRIPPGVGYTVSQVWRKWEGLTRSAFNGAQLDPETAAAFVEFDENLKRFSAGPPVTSSEELLALVNSGIVSLCTVDDPAVILSSRGWHLSEGDDTLLANVMIDAVLPSPIIKNVTDPLVTSALDHGILRQLSQGRGLLAAQGGQLFDRDGAPQSGLCALGRSTLGSVIAVDSLHDCFGETSTDWAAGVLDRALSRSA